MRMSCNGCRVLRKGCSENCPIRPCLHWIKTPDSQANATVFLAKFYGRAGLLNLINAAHHHLRPAVFRSLLYEACGRIVNPIYGSVGLLWSGNWALCQTAVEAILKGDPITQFASDPSDIEANNGPPLKAYDIRHRSKEGNIGNESNEHHVERVKTTRRRFKKSGSAGKDVIKVGGGTTSRRMSKKRSASHESSLSHQSEVGMFEDDDVVEELISLAEAEAETTTKGSSSHVEEGHEHDDDDEEGLGELALTLGFGFQRAAAHGVKPKHENLSKDVSDVGGETCMTKLGL